MHKHVYLSFLCMKVWSFYHDFMRVLDKYLKVFELQYIELTKNINFSSCVSFNVLLIRNSIMTSHLLKIFHELHIDYNLFNR